MIRPRSLFALLVALAACLAATAALAAGPAKVIRFAYPSGEQSFDPQRWSDQVTASVTENINEPLLTYDYLARPSRLVPLTAQALPEVRDNGATYMVRVTPGIFFASDAVFKAEPSELTARDYEYSIRRLFDPKVRSPWLFLLEGKLIGADAALAAARKTGRYDYDTPIAGIEVLDRYTLKFRLVAPDYTFLYALAAPATGAVAREVVEAYGDENGDVGAHPVGTGPFLLKEWRRRSRIVLEANPQFRGETLRLIESSDPVDQAIMRDIGGHRLPLIERIEIYIVEEEQPRWLAFLNKEHDFLNQLPWAFRDLVLPQGQLAPNLTKLGIRALPEEEPITRYTAFNMKHPVIGGYTPEKIALRRAISIAVDRSRDLKLLWKGAAVFAESPLPPGVAGYDPNFVCATCEYNPAKAKALLDMFGYLDRDGDSYRETPDGKPLTVEHASTPDLRSRSFDELLKKGLDEIGIRLTFRKAPLPDLVKAARLGKLQMFSYGWVADYPDGENFLQLLYGGTVGMANYAQFDLPEYNRLFLKARTLPDSPERTALYQQMSRLIMAYAPWRLRVHERQAHLVHPWVKGYKKHPFITSTWRYLDVDVELKQRLGGSP